MSKNELIVFRAKAKTFSLAARFFSDDLHEGASQVYYWCRYVDDFIDESKGNPQELYSKTREIWEKPEAVREGPYLALKSVASKYNIPRDYALDLITGMEMDSEGSRYKTIQDLEIYCYHVASTVGLMMCHVMGLFDAKALEQAAALGKAMQMTNIARDVREDFAMGRIYLPEMWLKEEGISSADLWEEQNRAKLFKVTVRLINESEKHYRQGMSGIIHLPFRAAVAVTMASLMYREIGRMIISKGETALESRMVVPAFTKFVLGIEALWEVFISLPQRLQFKKLVNIDVVWRP
jgi:phytoene synthase